MLVAYSPEWAEVKARFRDARELVRDTTGEVVPARILLTFEARRSEIEALDRLRWIDAEQNQPGLFVPVGGWPGFTRVHQRRMPEPDRGRRADGTPSMSTRVTVAIAVGARLVRFEGFVPPSAPPAWVDEILGIARGVRFEDLPVPGVTEDALRRLREGPRLVDPAQVAFPVDPDGPGFPDVEAAVERAAERLPNLPDPEGFLGVSSSTPSASNLVQRLRTSDVDSEIEIAVSNDGRTVVVVNNERDFATSADGGQTFVTTGVAPPPTGGDAHGNPSIAYGASGSFYFGAIGFPTAGQCSTSVAVSTDGGRSFGFRSNATLCDDSGLAGPTCFPDQAHLGADRANLSSTGQDRVYSTWRNFAGGGCGTGGSTLAVSGPEIPSLACSSDGATTWGGAVAVGTFGDSYPRIAVAQDGFVYVVYRAGANNIMLDRFSPCDSGLVRQVGYPVMVASISRVSCPIPGLDRCNDGSDMSSHTVAVDDTDPSHLFVAYAATSTAGVNEDVIMRDSTDRGATWPSGRSVQVSGSANARRFMPWVCSTGGNAYVTWYDTRNATSSRTDLTDFYGASASLDAMGNLVSGAEFRISGVSDPLCDSGWPSAPRAANDAEACPTQPQLAGRCLDTTGTPTGIRCDFSDCGGAGLGVGASCQCDGAAGETCNTGRGYPKYGDYNGNACANGQLFAAWASATSPPSITPASTTIDVFFDTPLNDPPLADAGPDQTLECALGGTTVQLDGTGSSDPDGQSLDYAWSGGFDGGVATGATPVVTYAGLGADRVTLTVEDPVGFEASDTVSITVEDTVAPSIVAPSDLSLECTGPLTPVLLGTPTVDDGCDPAVVVTNDAPSSFPVGTTTVTWTATDASGNASSATQVVTVLDTVPPDLAVSMSPRELWPPNHRMVSVAASIAVSDLCDQAPVVRLTRATSSEPDNDRGDGNTVNDIQGADIGTDDRQLRLRAERRGLGPGRIYTVGYEAEDASGNVAGASAQVVVPHNQ